MHVVPCQYYQQRTERPSLPGTVHRKYFSSEIFSTVETWGTCAYTATGPGYTLSPANTTPSQPTTSSTGGHSFPPSKVWWMVMVIACSMTNHPFTFLYLHASLAQPGWQCPCCWWSWQRSSVSLCLFLVKITAGYLPVHFPRASPSASSTRPRWTLWGSSLTTVRSRQSVIIHGENYF